LQRNEFYLTEAQRLGHIGSWLFDPSRGFDYWSRELFHIHGLDPATGAPGIETYLALVHPQDRAFMATLMKRLVVEPSEFDVTKRIVRPDGEVRHIRCVGAPVAGSGILKGIVGNAIDVTEHEILTRELRRREAYLAEAQRLSHTGSFGWKPGSGDIVWSDETYRIFEYDPAEKMTFDGIIERVHPEDRVSRNHCKVLAMSLSLPGRSSILLRQNGQKNESGGTRGNFGLSLRRSLPMWEPISRTDRSTS
jgi:PAS domain S-box-containing protein